MIFNWVRPKPRGTVEPVDWKRRFVMDSRPAAAGRSACVQQRARRV